MKLLAFDSVKFRRLLDETPDSPHAADARLILAESAFQAQQYDDVARRLEPLVAGGARPGPPGPCPGRARSPAGSPPTARSPRSAR